ncbi:MAG: hypothetical protein ACFFD4_31740 [Candidatus Odinarchaeota archaeon]
MTEFSIPGVVYKVRIRQDQGSHRVEVLLHGAGVSSINISSQSLEGIKKALQEAVQEAGIAHQVPPSVIENLAAKLTEAGGYLGEAAMMEAAKDDKLDLILQKLEIIEERLRAIEERLAM